MTGKAKRKSKGIKEPGRRRFLVWNSCAVLTVLLARLGLGRKVAHKSSVMKWMEARYYRKIP